MQKLPMLFVTVALLACGGAASAEVVNGTAFDDRLRGSGGDDTIRGKPGNDKLMGLGGDDLLNGGPGRDYLNGGQGLDDIGGGAGRDVIMAGRDSFEDRTYGQGGSDEIYVFGDDQVSAGGGNDLIYATYPGSAMFIICGAGHDEVVFNQTPPAGTVTTDDCEDVRVESAG
jgi:Ca2+-binding RTX toxin-like protein